MNPFFNPGDFTQLQKPGGLLYDFNVGYKPTEKDIDIWDIIFSGEKVPDMSGRKSKDVTKDSTIGKLLANINQMQRAQPKQNKLPPLYKTPYLANLLGG